MNQTQADGRLKPMVETYAAVAAKMSFAGAEAVIVSTKNLALGLSLFCIPRLYEAREHPEKPLHRGCSPTDVGFT